MTQAGVDGTMLHVEATFCYLGDMLCSSRGGDSQHGLGKGWTLDHYLNQRWPLQLTRIYVSKGPIHYKDVGDGLNVLREHFLEHMGVDFCFEIRLFVGELVFSNFHWAVID